MAWDVTVPNTYAESHIADTVSTPGAAATRNPDCVQNSLNVHSLSPDLQTVTVCRMTFGS